MGQTKKVQEEAVPAMQTAFEKLHSRPISVRPCFTDRWRHNKSNIDQTTIRFKDRMVDTVSNILTLGIAFSYRRGKP